jgi:flagellar M-ring protein FliF
MTLASNEDLYKEEHISTDYENAKTDETIHELPGKLLRLTVAAIVDLPQPDEGQQTTGPQLADVEKIIKQAVGYDEQRQDQIQVVSAPMTMTNLVDETTLAAVNWQRYLDLARNASLGIGGVAALLITVLILRRVKPIVVEAKPADQMSVDQIQQLIKVANLTRENPAVAARVLQSWINPETPEQDEQPDRRPIRKAG